MRLEDVRNERVEARYLPKNFQLKSPTTVEWTLLRDGWRELRRGHEGRRQCSVARRKGLMKLISILYLQHCLQVTRSLLVRSNKNLGKHINIKTYN